MIERKMLGKQQPEGEKKQNSKRREGLVNQTEVNKKTKINPEQGNTGRQGDLHLLESESDCSEERFIRPHLPVGATAVDSHAIIHPDIAERRMKFPVSPTLHNSTALLQRDAP